MSEQGNENRTYEDSVTDVMEHFGVSRNTVYNWLKSTSIPHRRIGATIRFNMDEVDEWAARGGRPTEGVA